MGVNPLIAFLSLVNCVLTNSLFCFPLRAQMLVAQKTKLAQLDIKRRRRAAPAQRELSLISHISLLNCRAAATGFRRRGAWGVHCSADIGFSESEGNLFERRPPNIFIIPWADAALIPTHPHSSAAAPLTPEHVCIASQSILFVCPHFARDIRVDY